MFFFNDKPNTEIYTYVHTLSLHDALPIFIATGIPYQGHGDFEEWGKILGAVGPQVAGIRRFGSAALDLAWVAAGRFDGFWESDLNRSEEHTSELQSLMRTSYAVFCLKKKKKKQYTSN